ncbi:hypothetical protein C7974DRAFT_92440 [Boeremia exigua]|uniref:uncharacterized protein n=1 Tax=Boeremia exigua TaxID=749465 RepID=UPI001E8CDE77|nr:uncharacterized protein C7974DRAFT_92440 [Boeremia exigua]KAH6612174.1 hypothetical protein C7974DRAFT_92440 [Boeremia exigua]
MPSLPSSYHPGVPQTLDAPLACCVLSLRQYLLWGNVDQMTLLAQKAFGLLGGVTSDYSLRETDLYAEASRRAWWMMYLCMCNASIVSCKPLAETIDINKVCVPYPSTSHGSEIWIRYIRAEEALVAATLLLVALVKGVKSEATIAPFNRSIHTLDSIISHQLSIHSKGTDVERTDQTAQISRLYGSPSHTE